jgi:hypothetical protein
VESSCADACGVRASGMMVIANIRWLSKRMVYPPDEPQL